MKNEKNNYYFECHKSKHYHRDCSEKNKRSKTIIIKIRAFDLKNDKAL